jgi:hypothetical protein
LGRGAHVAAIGEVCEEAIDSDSTADCGAAALLEGHETAGPENVCLLRSAAEVASPRRLA